MRLSRETALIAAICVADLISTIWLVHVHGAEEANPLMNGFLQHGVGAFILAKSLFCLGPLALIEWARRHRPAFCRRALRAGIALYVGFYGIVVWKINHPSEEPGEPHYTAAEVAQITANAEMPATPEELGTGHSNHRQ